MAYGIFILPKVVASIFAGFFFLFFFFSVSGMEMRWCSIHNDKGSDCIYYYDDVFIREVFFM